jgi:hypothetical protein
MLGMPFRRRAPFLLTDDPAGPQPPGRALQFLGGQSDDFAGIFQVKQSILFSIF